MPAEVAIVHGWSDTSKSFLNLRDFLSGHGYQTTQIWLGDYVSMDDDVRVEDVGKRMESVIRAAIVANQLTVPFDLIVHSTGGLVAREWLSRFYPDGQNAPVKKVIMLAPANFGSRLASLGKSMIGRVIKGWNNWFQTGTQMLIGLELASAYQWDLARRDLLDPAGNGSGPYGLGKIWPFVIVGSRPYTSQLRQIVNEDGSDGTVRCAAANLNAVGMTVDFSVDINNPEVRPWSWRSGQAQFPFAVLPDRDHSSIHEPSQESGAQDAISQRLGDLILAALACDTAEGYQTLYTGWQQITEQTADLSQNDAALQAAFKSDPPNSQMLHQYLQVLAVVRDDQGQVVDDYFLEFFAPEQKGTEDAVYFHQHVLDDVHVNSQSSSRRCLFIDRTDLMIGFYPLMRVERNRQLAVSISAAALGDNIRYFDKTSQGAAGHLIVHEEDETKRAGLAGRLFRNTTHLIEVIVPRQPIDKVFKLSQ
jgi:pimeloyl-ACP methyl ester carboxylesterase